MRIVFYCPGAMPDGITDIHEIAGSGTQKDFVLVTNGLAALGHDVIVCNNSDGLAFRKSTHLRVRDTAEFIKTVNSLPAVDVLVLNKWSVNHSLLHDTFAAVRIKVAWLHNFVPIKEYEKAIRNGSLDYLLCVSRGHLATYCLSRYLNRFTYIFNPIDTTHYGDFPLSCFREDKIMFVGAPRQCKGFHDALRIFLKFHQRNPTYTLSIAGAADFHFNAGELGKTGLIEKEYGSAYVNKYLYDPDGNIRPCFVLLGKLPRKQLYHELLTAKACLQNPSWESEAETLGMSSVEAQSLGVPVVTTSRGGHPDVIKHKKTGFLVTGKNDMAFVRALEKIVKNPQIFQYNAEAIRRSAGMRFGQEHIVHCWDRVLKKMICKEYFCNGRISLAARRIKEKLRVRI